MRPCFGGVVWLEEQYKDDSLVLHTDLYQINMMKTYWDQGIADKHAVFEGYFRKYPFKNGYAVYAVGRITVVSADPWLFVIPLPCTFFAPLPLNKSFFHKNSPFDFVKVIL